MQILPPPVLLPYIKHYLFLESDTDKYKRLRLFSDGNTGMVFILNQGNLFIHHYQHLPHSFLYGQISHFKDLALKEQTSFIIIVFQPDGLYKLLGIPAHELKDQILPTHEIFGQSAEALYDSLIYMKKHTDQLSVLNTFFYNLSTKRKKLGPSLVPALLQYVAHHKGILTVKQMSHYTGYTERQLERVFAQQIGVSPKKFSNIVQLHSFLKLLRTKPAEMNLTSISHQGGYFDQSHLIRAFKSYTGISPSEYLYNTNRLAVNFMEFKDIPDDMSGLYNFA